MKEIESVVETPGSQDIDLMEISPTIFKSPLLTQSDTSKKRTNDHKLFQIKYLTKKQRSQLKKNHIY